MSHKEKIITICQRCDITLCNNLKYPVYIVGNPIPSDKKELENLEDWAIETIEDITKLIHYQPIDIVDRAFEPNGKPKFDIILSYEEEKKKYKKISLPKESKENLANIQKLKDDVAKEKKFEEIIKDLNPDDFIIEETHPLGYYKIYGRYGRPEVVLLLQNIYDHYDTKKRNNIVTLTYIHELMHAVMHVHTNNEFIEEPLAEMGMLCFVHDAIKNLEVIKYDEDSKTYKTSDISEYLDAFESFNISNYENLEKTAKDEVKAKQGDASTCHYGFGKYLYDTLSDPEYGWSVGSLMKQYIIMSEALSDCFEYEKYFIVGYPKGALQESALKKLFKILHLYPIQANIPEGKETVYEWSKGNNA